MVLVKRNNNLGIRSRGELVVGGLFELLADAVVVIELAIDDCMDLAVRRVEWLSTVRRKVVDGESYVTKRCYTRLAWFLEQFSRRRHQSTDSVISADPLTTSVRTTVLDLVEGGVELLREAFSVMLAGSVELLLCLSLAV